MKLSTLIQPLLDSKITGQVDRNITDICQDSRRVQEGSLFAALPGSKTDGHLFIKDVVQKKAAAVLYQRGCFEDTAWMNTHTSSTTFIETADARKALGIIAHKAFDCPSEKITLIGITGTNGKTTTATLLYTLFNQMGLKSGLLSTIANYVGEEMEQTALTTPDVLTINRLLSKMVQSGCSHCFMEVSSHAIDQQRTAGLHFAGGIFTNLTHDHLDYHNTFDKYRDTKKAFFDTLPSDAFALTNADDRNGKIVVQNTRARVYTYACKQWADFTARVMERTVEGMQLVIHGTELWSPLIGMHNVYNLLSVYACARLLDMPADETLRRLSSLQTVSGRMEYVRGGNHLTAVVDYAHTPDALKNALTALRELLLPGQQLICVVGCGGDRDRTKRPVMAQIADAHADVCVFTSDNPRFEDPETILDHMMDGLSAESRERCLRITDRYQAIKTAVRTAPKGAVILVAGKGHETYQDIQGVKKHFDDKEILTQLLNTG